MFTASVFFLSCGVMLGRYNKNTASAADLIKKPTESTESGHTASGFKNYGRDLPPETEAETTGPETTAEPETETETEPETEVPA